MHRTLFIVIALVGCVPDDAPVRDDAGDRARVSVPDKLAPDDALDPIGRHRRAGPRLQPMVRQALGGQEGEPVWDGLHGADADADDLPAPPPPPEPIDTADTGLP